MIREATVDDGDAMYDICLRTGAAGSDATGLYRDRRLLGDIYVGPYLALPGCIGVVFEDAEGIGGYSLAAIDTAAFEAECERSWWPPLRRRHPDPGHAPRDSDGALIANIHRPPSTDPDVLERYPAHLHIDLLPRIQGGGRGRELMAELLDRLIERGVEGVHLGVDGTNTRAIGFYEHLGFETAERTAVDQLMVKRLG